MEKLFFKRHENFCTVLPHINEENFPHIYIFALYFIYIYKKIPVYFEQEKNFKSDT